MKLPRAGSVETKIHTAWSVLSWNLCTFFTNHETKLFKS